ncbi:hypothetical protein FIV07_06720 [Mycobacterium sp. THAF192]|nr:hypothetical protein FIV07_06720 [Mycobacterium sp. THAF192]
MVQVGLGAVEATISTNDLVLKQVRLLGSLGSNQSDLRTVLDLISTGAFSPRIEVKSRDVVYDVVV